MTRKEMAEIFGVMMLAWPSAEMFKGGIGKLGPTIELWTACLPGVDFWTGQQAVIRLCQTCKFPPTIAEFKERAESVQSDIQWRIRTDWDMLRFRIKDEDATSEWYERLAPESYSRLAIDAIGGPQAMFITRIAEYGDGSKKEYTALNYEGYAAAYERLLRKENALSSGKKAALPAARKDES